MKSLNSNNNTQQQMQPAVNYRLKIFTSHNY